MKNFIAKYSVCILLIAMLAALVPGINNRLVNEKKNDNVTISVLYNDMANKLNQENISSVLEQYKKAGIDTVSVMEDDLNSLVARGDLTCIKYNVLNHKYDEESIGISEFIKENCPQVSFDSYIIIVHRDNINQKLSYMLSKKFTEDEYTAVGTFGHLNIYVIHEGRDDMWNYVFGYDEQIIKQLTDQGFKVALVHKVKNYSNYDYLEDIDTLVKKYNIRYMNIKASTDISDSTDINPENYIGISEIITKNNMTLVVTENMDQLSNQKCLGYSYIFENVMKNGGPQKVVRSYETYDDSQSSNDSGYGYRVEQFYNSTIDRNIRFITVTQLAPDGIPFDKCAEHTLSTAIEYKNKIENLGFSVNKDVEPLNYTANKRLNSAFSIVIMIACIFLMLNMTFGKKGFMLSILAILLSAIAFAATFIVPASLLSLYPTMFCIILSCFSITLTMHFIKTNKDRMNILLLEISTVFILVSSLLIGSIVTGTLLSGIDYYINNEIFRGIKLSLIIPMFYSVALYYFMFIKNTISGIVSDIKKVFNSEIKVYWVIIAFVILIVAGYYIIRSGNVNKISAIEKTMRSTITEYMPARPRTKEFLIGYPSLILFVYYMKNTNIQLLKWAFAAGTSILAASITNSFCHVFTDYTFIVTRTLNGLLLGIIISIIAYVANIIIIKLVKALINKFNQHTEMR